MNQNILKKAIDELSKDKPRLEYVLGLLEGIYEGGNNISALKTISDTAGILPKWVADASDEAAMMDAKARAAIEYVKTLPNE